MPLEEIYEQQILPPFVSLAHHSDVTLWCQLLKCSERELRDAVACSGCSSDVVQLYLLCRRLMEKAYLKSHCSHH